MTKQLSDWIAAGNWTELERLAKREPSVALADELSKREEELTEKQDLKAVRKLLFLLKTHGIEPSQRKLHPPGTLNIQAAEFIEYGYLVTANSSGETRLNYGYQVENRVRWLLTTVSRSQGIITAKETDVSPEAAETWLHKLAETPVDPFVGIVVPGAFALARLKQALTWQKSQLPTSIAFWRSRIEQASNLQHPAEQLPRTPQSPEELRRLSVAQDETILWRLELGTANPILQALHDLQKQQLPQEERKAQTDKIISENRQQIFTPEVLEDHTLRLLDLAYAWTLKGKEPGALLTAADDLRKSGPDSDYAKGLLDKTVVLLVDRLSNKPESTVTE